MLKTHNNIGLPEILLGTDYRSLNDENRTYDLIYNALKLGFRAIDTAWMYHNEHVINAVLKKCYEENILKREDLFLQTKVPHVRQGYNSTLEAFDYTIKKLGVDYLDSYLIHYPLRYEQHCYDLIIDSWRAMEKLHKEGKIKVIGVCNFTPQYLNYLISKAEIMPMINQIQYHPQHQQKETVELCKKHEIIVEAFAPLYQGKLCENETIKETANRVSKTPAQVILNWHKNNGIVPITKPCSINEIKENINSFDFELSSYDISTINDLDYGEYWKLHDDNRHTAEPLEYAPYGQQNNTQVITYKLFGFIPLFKEKIFEPTKSKYYLFNIPVLKKTIKNESYEFKTKEIKNWKIEPIYTQHKHFFEGPIYDTNSKMLAFLDYSNKSICVCNTKRNRIKFYNNNSDLGCIFFKDSNHIISAEKDGLFEINLSNKNKKLLINPMINKRVRINDGKMDSKGRLVFGTYSNYDDGYLFSYDGTNLKVLKENVCCSNGIAFNNDSTIMYYIDTATKKVSRYKYDIKNGDIEFLENVISFKETSPDGMCIDSDENLYIAELGGYKISIWETKNYSKIDEIELPFNPTSVCLGDDEITLFITSAGSNNSQGGVWKLTRTNKNE